MQIRSVDRKTSNEILFQIKSLIKDNWGDEYNNLNEIEREVFLAKNTTGLPNIYYVLVKEEVIAIISLLEKDLEGYPIYSPWLANLFVKEVYRLQGIGNMLCAKLKKDAEELGYKEIYLYTCDAADFYTQRNWVIIKEFIYKNLNYKLLKIELISKTRTTVKI